MRKEKPKSKLRFVAVTQCKESTGIQQPLPGLDVQGAVEFYFVHPGLQPDLRRPAPAPPTEIRQSHRLSGFRATTSTLQGVPPRLQRHPVKTGLLRFLLEHRLPPEIQPALNTALWNQLMFSRKAGCVSPPVCCMMNSEKSCQL